MGPYARFDDLTAGAERSFALSDLRQTVVARGFDEVVPAMVRVEELAAQGLWAGGFVAYEAAPAFNPALDVARPLPSDPFSDLPLLWFGLYGSREEVEPFKPRHRLPAPYSVSAWTAEIDRDGYEQALEQIHRRIDAGDTEQLNFSFRLQAAFAGEPSELYRDLLLAQRGAHGACFDADRFHIVSASPEGFFKLSADQIEVRPMKGTLARGRWAKEDRDQAIRLLGSDQERAQNLRVVQAISESLGTVAVPGSVRIEEVLELERLETVWQLTSRITAEPKAGISAVDAFKALFPLCSITGLPQAKTMEIIAELEPSPRGVYCGAIGYIAPPGVPGSRANFNVAIRTVAIDREEGLAVYGVGGGISRDSSSSAEYGEARSKARLLAERRPDFDLWETVRWEPPEGFWLLEEHLERLAASADYFGFLFDRERVRRALDEAVGDCSGGCAVRVAVGRDGQTTASMLEGDMAEKWEPGSGPSVRVAIARDAIPSHNVFLFHQTSRHEVYSNRARASTVVPADDVILINERDEITQATNSNVAVLIDGRWCTPPVESGCVAGVYRQSLIEKGMLEVRPIMTEEAKAAEEIALLSSVHGWRRAHLVTE
jgi:para-aminobenzoate synthetase/4-amino-4-deoxychorismate lyase